MVVGINGPPLRHWNMRPSMLLAGCSLGNMML